LTGITKTSRQAVYRHKRLLAPLAILALFALGAIIAVIAEPPRTPVEPDFVVRDEPVADLLSWVPATDLTRRAFAVWTPDSGLVTPLAPSETARLQDQIGMKPEPHTLGHTLAWWTKFGWEAGQVTGWATAGSGSDFSVLTGEFDIALIKVRLAAAGYVQDSYRGVDIYTVATNEPKAVVVAGDSHAAASAIAILDGRILTARDRSMVSAAIDAARDGRGSLLDDPSVSRALATLSPVSAIVAVAVADLAAQCNPAASGVNMEDTASLNPVIVAYGRNGTGGERRTTVAVVYPDEGSAANASPAFETGWFQGFANAGGAGASIATFGTLTVVSRTGPILTAELVDGRDDGWVRAGIRFAIPVCEAVLALAPPPVATWLASPVVEPATPVP
jgi:Protein of unknown function (DUF3352)